LTGKGAWPWRTAERVRREVAALLDVEDPIPCAYTLEVFLAGF